MASKLKFSNDFKMRITKDANFINQIQRMDGVDYEKYKHFSAVFGKYYILS